MGTTQPPTATRVGRLPPSGRPWSVNATPLLARAPTCSTTTRPRATRKDDDTPLPDLGAGLKAAWYSAEAVGNLVGAAKAATAGAAGSSKPCTSSSEPLSFADAARLVREDYDSVYFVSGKGDLAAYDPNCYFADPFAGFSGTERFVRNVSNLGSTLSDVRLKLTSFEADEASRTIRTAWTFSGVVDALPWRPRLAAAGSTTHTLDPTSGRVVRHIEAWSSSPREVVAALVKPASAIPTNRWERAAAAAAAGDARGCAAAGLKAAALTAFHAAGILTAGRLVSGGSMSAAEAFFWGGGLVQAGLDVLLPIFGTPGEGGAVRRKERR